MAARLSQPAEQAFETYITNLETRLARQHAGPDTHVAMLDRHGEARTVEERELLAGAVRVEPVNGGTWQVTGGLLHHWRAATLVTGTVNSGDRPSAKDMLALLRDHDHLGRYYAPDVVRSRALTDDGERATVAIRFKKQRIITVVLDGEFETHSALIESVRGYAFSRSRHIWQIDQPGLPQEHRREEGNDDGFLWRLNSYWSFEERGEGLLIECEAVSLTRDVPIGLGWLISPIIQSLPRDSLEFTLTATKNALANTRRRHNHDRTK